MDGAENAPPKILPEGSPTALAVTSKGRIGFLMRSQINEFDSLPVTAVRSTKSSRA